MGTPQKRDPSFWKSSDEFTVEGFAEVLGGLPELGGVGFRGFRMMSRVAGHRSGSQVFRVF